MAEVIDFAKAKAAQKKQRQDSKRILCLEGHHKWIIRNAKPFENKQGKLVSVYRCKHCQQEKTVLQ